MPNAQRILLRSVYTDGIDELGNVLFQTNQVQYAQERHKFIAELGRLAEAIILTPTVIVRTSARGLVLPIIMDFLGDAEAVLQILDSGALEFLTWTHGIGSLGSVVLAMPSPIIAERDPGSLFERDLSIAFSRLDPGVKTAILEAAVKKAVPTNADEAEDAIQVAMRFADLGVFGDRIPGHSAFIDAADAAIISAARRLAEDLHETALILGREYDVFETNGSWSALKRIGTDIKASMGLVDAVESVYRTASVPSIRDMIKRGQITPKELLKIRNHPATAEFRKWLWQRDRPHDGKKLAQDFVKALDRGLDPNDATLYRSARILVVNILGESASRVIGASLGEVVGHALAGEPGKIAGAALGFAASTTVSLTDPWIPEFLKKPDPRRFTDQVLRPLSKRE